MSYTLVDRIADQRLNCARHAAAQHYTERTAEDENLLAGMQEDFINATREQLLADSEVMSDMLADHWAAHPYVGRLIFHAAGDNDTLRRAGISEIQKIYWKLAEAEAARRWQAGERA